MTAVEHTDKKEHNRHIPFFVAGVIVIIAVIAALLVWLLPQDGSSGVPPVNENPVESESIPPSEVPAPSYLAMPIDVEGSETLSQLFYLMERNAVPAEYIPGLFIGKKIYVAYDPTLSDAEVQFERAENYMHTYSDVVFFINQDSGVNQPEGNDYLNSCICIQNERYVFIAASEQYADAAKYFEQQINDPTVLDMEDLLLRMQNYGN